MAGFSPHKKHARQFTYTPRYYDPLKEEFEKRREELRGERRDKSTANGDNEYIPGQYIRSKRMAREAKRRESTNSGRSRLWIPIVVVALVFLFGSILYPKLLNLFGMASSGAPTEVVEESEWNPYRPIEVVPNDYVEE